MDQLIRNATIVNEGRRLQADLRIRRGRIESIDASLAAREGEVVFDAGGRLLLPGLIDDQVHFREPGLEHKATIATESRAAVAGGITTFMDMPNTRPPAVTQAALADKFARAAVSSVANYSFYLGATNDNIDEIRRTPHGAACALKVFMGASTGNMLVDDPATLDAIFRDAPLLVVTHCEDTPTIEANLAAERAAHAGPLDVTRHPYIRSREACIKSSRLAIELARRHDARLHILHVSTADELALFDRGPLARKRITAETCTHFLHFDADDYPRLGNRIKCNPAIKLASDRRALIAGLRDGLLDVLATDHAPHTADEKNQSYEQAPAGLPLVQHHLQAVLERVHEGEIPIETLVERACHAPAVLFGVRDRGFVREGFHADLVLVDMQRSQFVRREEVLSKCGWSPFEGQKFRSTVVATWVNGHRAWHDGRLDDSVLGQRVEITRARD
ncbi:MAG TPA: dihydroorotase [Candidatus Saccharimonadia bacterium]|nr:dihydroorotase [Candidatus Saccharimonadia bacterium]